MILQRLAKAIRRQDWFTVVLEVAIVVAGILIALQVENWNDERKARAEAADWRRQILADLRQARFDLEGRRTYNAQALAFGERSLELLISDAALDENETWDMVLGAFQAGQIWPYRLDGPAFRQAQSAGGLGLVAGQEAIVTLAYFYDVSAYDYELITGGLPRYRSLIRERMPWPLQAHIWDANCQADVLAEGATDYRFELVRCAPPDDLLLIRASAESLRADREVQDALRGRLSQLKVSDASTSRLIERADYAIRVLEDAG